MLKTATEKRRQHGRNLSVLRFSRHIDAVCRESAKATGTIYHGTTEAGPDYDTKTKNLDTVYDAENLLNLRGAHELTPETVADCRRTAGRDLVTFAAQIAVQERSVGRHREG